MKKGIFGGLLAAALVLGLGLTGCGTSGSSGGFLGSVFGGKSASKQAAKAPTTAELVVMDSYNYGQSPLDTVQNDSMWEEMVKTGTCGWSTVGDLRTVASKTPVALVKIDGKAAADVATALAPQAFADNDKAAAQNKKAEDNYEAAEKIYQQTMDKYNKDKQDFLNGKLKTNPATPNITEPKKPTPVGGAKLPDAFTFTPGTHVFSFAWTDNNKKAHTQDISVDMKAGVQYAFITGESVDGGFPVICDYKAAATDDVNAKTPLEGTWKLDETSIPRELVKVGEDKSLPKQYVFKGNTANIGYMAYMNKNGNNIFTFDNGILTILVHNVWTEKSC
jgi:hypothetical protein